MAPVNLTNLPSLRRHHLLAEFAGLKQLSPPGIFLSIHPNDPTLWSGILFVRSGPYSPAILRFTISFPPAYPQLPPLITFSTDIFHPLITPLTTYVHSTDVGASGTVSAGDEERLPPGGFSLRHGFGSWFGRGGGAGRRSRQVSGQSTETEVGASEEGLAVPPLPPRPGRGTTGLGISAADGGSTQSTPDKLFKTAISDTGSPSATAFAHTQNLRPSSQPHPTIHDILVYLLSTFDSESVLDSIPLEAAGNPGAWHAWKARQQKSNPDSTSTATTRKPGEWNWEGVWEERVKRGVNASLSEAVLFGGAAGDEIINFLNMDEEDVKGVKENLFRTLGVEAPAMEKEVETEAAF